MLAKLSDIDRQACLTHACSAARSENRGHRRIGVVKLEAPGALNGCHINYAATKHYESVSISTASSEPHVCVQVRRGRQPSRRTFAPRSARISLLTDRTAETRGVTRGTGSRDRTVGHLAGHSSHWHQMLVSAERLVSTTQFQARLSLSH